MKHSKSILGGSMLLFSIFSMQGAEPTGKGFKKLNEILIEATEILSEVTTPEQLPQAIKSIRKIQKKYGHDKAVEAVLSLSSSTCPANLFKEYQDALQNQAALKDAGKRLAMAGILRNDEYGMTYRDFTEKMNLPDENTDEQTVIEGAPYETKEQRDKRMQWWRDGKFGMFIHYGLYSGLAGELNGNKYEGCVEWIQMQSGMDSENYGELALKKFKPQTGKAKEWVALAKEAGCTYTVLTSRHHEGFNMFDTQYSDFNVKKATGVDVIDEYAKACTDMGMKAGYYFSLLDWYHPDYDPTGSGISYPKGNYDAEKLGKRTFGNHEKYKQYLYNIFDDLTSKYQVDLVWWDFSQPKFQGDKAWGATNLMKNLFEKYPMAIQNNRLYHSDNHLSEGGIKVTPTWKGDYSTAEHHIPATGIDGDWEACQTLNGTWGYSAENQKWKTSEALIQELIDAVSRGGNFLLNIGPEPDGSIPQESIRLFKEIGAWMQINNEAIYGTRANPFDVELDWGRVTRKGDDEIFIFVYKKPENNIISLPCIFEEGTTATLLDGGKKMKTSTDKNVKTTSIDVCDLSLNNGPSVIKIKGKRI
ncbi:MAG: alpha-L-fucosidase [Bacteroidales bacterium]